VTENAGVKLTERDLALKKGQRKLIIIIFLNSCLK